MTTPTAHRGGSIPPSSCSPTRSTDPNDRVAWLSFTGRWGQRERGFFNGPTGPYAKGRWTEPVTWHESLRSASVVIPGAEGAGSVATTFCDVVEVGSTLLVRTLRDPTAAFVLVLALLGGVAVVAMSTSWRRVETRPIRQRRAIGQILRASGRVVRDRPVAMAVIGVLAVPVALLTSALQWTLLAVPPIDAVVGAGG